MICARKIANVSFGKCALRVKKYSSNVAKSYGPRSWSKPVVKLRDAGDHVLLKKSRQTHRHKHKHRGLVRPV